MARIEREIVIAQPVEKVFDFLAEGRNDPLWNREDLHMEKSPDGPVHVGTTFEGQVILFGRRDVAYRITGYDRPQGFAFQVTKPPIAMDLTGAASFEPVPLGTRMVWRIEVLPHGPLAVLTPLITRVIDRRLADSFREIKRVLELDPR